MNKIIDLLKSKSTLGEKVFEKNYPNEYERIIEYTNPFNIFDWCERKYFFINQLKEIPKCKICNNNTRYYKSFNRYADTCCRECDKKLKSQSHSKIWNNYTEEEKQNRLEHAAIIREENTGYKTPFADPEVKEKIKDVNISKYGVDNIFKNDKFKQYIKENYFNNKEFQKNKGLKVIQTNQVKYGVNSYTQTKEGKKKVQQTMIDRYGSYNYAKTDNFKKLFEDEQFVKNIVDKNYQTKKKNNSFNTSKPEEIIYDLLITKFPNTIRQYKDDRYPFNCDFYIPELDLFIEYNGTWTHGDFPFNNDDRCLKILNEWKSKSIDSQFYKNAIYNWTIRDPKKRQIAKENKLNWLEFFNMEDFNAWFELL